MKKLTRLQKEVLFGILLGDASLQWNEKKTLCRLRFTQKDKEYCMHIYEIFREFVNTPPQQNKKTGVWYFNSLLSPVFRFYCHQFYTKDGVKKIPRLIHRWLTPRTIAYWYMDDGSVKDMKTSSGVRFCTDCFSKQEVMLLSQIMTCKFGLKTSIFKQRNTHRLYISGTGNTPFIFANLIRPYLLVCQRISQKIPSKWQFPEFENFKKKTDTFN